MASRPIDLRTPAPEPVRRARLQVVPDALRSVAPVADPPRPVAPMADATDIGTAVRFEEDRAERRERLATTGRGPRRLAANLLVVADAWLAPHHPESDRSAGVTETPMPADGPTTDLTTPRPGTIDLTTDPGQVGPPAPRPLRAPRERPLRARQDPGLSRQDRPLRARQDQPGPTPSHPTPPRPARTRAAQTRPAQTCAPGPGQAHPDGVERPLRAHRERPLRAPQRRAATATPVVPGRPTTPPSAGRTQPDRVVAVPVGPSPVVAMESMRDHDTSDRRPSVAPPAEQPAHARRPGSARKAMPDPRAVSPEAAADEEAWQAWLSSSEPAGDRMEQLDADLAKGPRRLSRWVDAAATGRRTRTD